VTSEAPPCGGFDGEIIAPAQLRADAELRACPAGIHTICSVSCRRDFPAMGNFATDMRGGAGYSMGGPQINGQRKDTNFMTLDGVSNTRKPGRRPGEQHPGRGFY